MSFYKMPLTLHLNRPQPLGATLRVVWKSPRKAEGSERDYKCDKNNMHKGREGDGLSWQTPPVQAGANV